MHRKDWEAGNPLPTYQIRNFAGFCNFHDFLENEDDPIYLSVAVDVCPFIEEVDLQISQVDYFPDALKPLCKLRNLKELSLNGMFDMPKSSFLVSIVPVLEGCGKSLTKVCLIGFTDVDVEVIGRTCSILEHLSLVETREFVNSLKESTASPSNGRLFSCLKNFTCFTDSFIMPVEGEMEVKGGIPRSHLKEILCAPLLENIEITGSYNLTFDLLSEVLNQGQTFPHLTELKLISCKNLTPDFIQTLLHLPGPLKLITLQECRMISQTDFDSFESIIQGSHLDVRIRGPQENDE